MGKKLNKDRQDLAVAMATEAAVTDRRLAKLEFFDRNMGLYINGTRQVDLDMDPTDLGVDEINVVLPGVKLRISLR